MSSTAPEEDPPCEGATFPPGGIAACTSALVDSAARAATSTEVRGDYMGIIESLEFKSICGEQAPCDGTLACTEKILEFCLNPTHVNVASGVADALNSDARSMRNYPIFESEFCQTALQKILRAGGATVSDNQVLGGTRSVPSGAHEALTAFCSAYGAGAQMQTNGIAYARYLEPSVLVAELSRPSGSTAVAPPGGKWKLRGVPFGESVDPEVHQESRDVMIVSLDVPASPPQIVTRVVNGAVQPYAPRARIGFYSTDVGGYQTVAPNGLTYMNVFKDVETYNATNFGAGEALQSTQISVCAAQLRTVFLDLTGGLGPPTETQVMPEFHGTVSSCTVSSETGLVIIDIINVYVNAAQLYATRDANCDCFVPYTFVSGSGGGITHPPNYFVSPAASLTANNTSPEGTLCRYAWNEIPSPTNLPGEYERAEVGWFSIRMFKSLNSTNTGLPTVRGVTPFNVRNPNVASADVFTINGAFELSTPSPKALLQELCACHLPAPIYANYFTYLSKSGVGGTKDVSLFPGCASSRYPNAARSVTEAAAHGTVKLLPCNPRLDYNPTLQKFSSPDSSCLLNSFVSPNAPVVDATVLSPNPTTDAATLTAVSGVGLMTIVALAAILAAVIIKGRAVSHPKAMVIPPGLPR